VARRDGGSVDEPERDPNLEGRALFSPGEIVHHLRFDYRGVVVDVDATFQLSDEWYDEVARSRPPKDQPWYHVLVHDREHMTYVAQRHLEADPEAVPIRHPMLDRFFTRFVNGRYEREARAN